MKTFKKLKKGFTLVELVVVIAVIAILAAVSVGAYFGVTESANNSRLEQEAKQVYTAIQTVSLAPNEHSSLSKDGLVITDDLKFELALEETLGKNVTLLENGDKAANEPTIYFVRKAVSPEISENVVYSSFDYHVADINGKKAVTDVVTGEVKVETSNVEAGEGSSTTTAPGATTDPITGNPTTAPSTSDTTQEPLYEDGWHLVTTASEIKDGDQIVIVAKDYDVAMSTCQNNNNRGTAAITKNDNGTIELSNDVQPILVGIDNEKYTFSTSAGYLYAASSSKNYLRSYSEVDDNGRWTIEIGGEGSAIIKASGSYTRNTIKYNDDQNNGMLFSCYSSGQTDVVIYKNYGTLIEENAPLFNAITLEDSNLNLSLTTLESSIEYPPIIKQYSNGASVATSKDDFTWTSNSTLISFGEESIIPSGEYGNETVTVTVTLKEDTNYTLTFDISVNISEPGSEVDPNPGEGEVSSSVTFELGENGSQSHNDGSSDKSTYTETVNEKTLSISGGSKMYPSSRDAKGNGCIKFGASSAAGKMSFTVSNDVTSVVIEVAGYKGNTAKINVNGTSSTISTFSNDGEYTEITVDTTTNKTVSFTTQSGGYRCMVNSITYNFD